MIMSVDIGIRNLSLCIMSCDNTKEIIFDTFKIHLWDVFDTLDTEEHFCKSYQKNKNLCNKKCAYKYLLENNNVFTCKSHFPKELLPIQKCNNFKKKMINDYLLQDIADIILTKFQLIYEDNIILFTQLKSIIIELQPKINQKMKFISHIIYGKLVELMKQLPLKCTIRFVRASQKLKAYTGPEIECKLKGAYAKRKWLSIAYTKWFLENKFNIEEKEKWIPILLSHKKTDDMTDCMLMAINALVGIPKKQKMNFKKDNIT